MRLPLSWLRLLAVLGPLLVLPSALHGQLSARLDLSMSNRYLWHGLSRAAGVVLQPSAAVGVRHGGLTLEGGWVRHYELDEVQAGELSETGAGDRKLGEDDSWGRGGLRLGSFQFHAGVVHYRFHGTEAAGGLGSGRNTTEIYGAFSATSLYLNPTLEYWHDVDRVRGAFLRASASLPLLGWPYPPYVFLFIDGDVGVNLGQGSDPPHPRQLANFADRGVTHTSLGLTADLRSFHWVGRHPVRIRGLAEPAGPQERGSVAVEPS